MNFKDYIKEAKEKEDEKTAVMAFGRFNPPTVGHEKLIQKVRSVADQHNAKGHVFASHTELKEKDPLPQKAKIGYLNQIAHGNEIHGSSSAEPTFLHAAAKLHSMGHKHLVMIAGSDRIKEYKDKLEKYNDGKDYPHGKYKFKSIKVVSSGERDPDAEGVEGMSGTKMRDLARNNKHKQFENGLPVALKDNSKEIGDHIRAVKPKNTTDTTKAPAKTTAAKPKAKTKEQKSAWPRMDAIRQKVSAVKEDYENPHRFDDATPEGTAYMQKMTPGQKVECLSGVWSEKLGTCVSVREAYIQNEIFKLNDVVEATNGDKGPIVFRGSSYVTIQVKENKTAKHWLKDIQETNKVWPVVEPVPTKKANEQKIPALFMSKEQLEEMTNSKMELEYQGYQTQNLHMCPGASIQLHALVKRTDLNPTYILQAVQASDQYLGIEEEAMKQGFADDRMVHDFNMKLAIAHDTLNMLGYTDSELTYMTNHIREMSRLSMHKDGTFANEISSTIPTFDRGDVEEGFNSADYRVIVGKGGKEYKVRANRIITDKDGNGAPDGGKQVKETITMSKLRSKMAEATNNVSTPQYINKGSYDPMDPPTAHRDVNLSPDKEVYHGIDHTIDLTNFEGKPLGLVSFKSFMATPETAKIEQEKGQAMQDVHRAKAELAIHSSAYKLMKKANQQDN